MNTTCHTLPRSSKIFNWLFLKESSFVTKFISFYAIAGYPVALVVLAFCAFWLKEIVDDISCCCCTWLRCGGSITWHSSMSWRQCVVVLSTCKLRSFHVTNMPMDLLVQSTAPVLILILHEQRSIGENQHSWRHYDVMKGTYHYMLRVPTLRSSRSPRWFISENYKASHEFYVTVDVYVIVKHASR